MIELRVLRIRRITKEKKDTLVGKSGRLEIEMTYVNL